MRIFFTLSLLFVWFMAPAQVFQPYENQPSRQSVTTAPPVQGEVEVGWALYYADYLHGRSTALGEVYLRDQYTGAHKSLPLGTLVKVTRIDNGMSVIVRINDRGPYCNECAIDVSAAAAQAIDLLRVGRTRVSLEVVGHSDRNPVPNTSTTQARPQSYDAPRTDLTVRGGTPAQQQQQVSRDQQVNIIANEVKGYAIQLGSFGEFSNAERRVISLQQQGFDQIFIYQQTREGKTYHKVVFAPFVTASDAQRRLEELRANHQLDGMVIRLAW